MTKLILAALVALTLTACPPRGGPNDPERGKDRGDGPTPHLEEGAGGEAPTEAGNEA